MEQNSPCIVEIARKERETNELYAYMQEQSVAESYKQFFDKDTAKLIVENEPEAENRENLYQQICKVADALILTKNKKSKDEVIKTARMVAYRLEGLSVREAYKLVYPDRYNAKMANPGKSEARKIKDIASDANKITKKELYKLMMQRQTMDISVYFGAERIEVIEEFHRKHNDPEVSHRNQIEAGRAFLEYTKPLVDNSAVTVNVNTPTTQSEDTVERVSTIAKLVNIIEDVSKKTDKSAIDQINEIGQNLG